MTQLLAALTGIMLILLPGDFTPAAEVDYRQFIEGEPTITVEADIDIVVADDQGDLYVDHADEPFTVAVDNCIINVASAIETHIMISAVPPGVTLPTVEQFAIIDTFGDDVTLFLDPAVSGVWNYSVVVIVNGFSQVSNLTGQANCQ